MKNEIETWRFDLKTAMAIGGSDSGGGAGIQADLKTFSAYGIHGTTVITAVTAQNTTGVMEIFRVPANTVKNQVKSIMEDIGADAVKTGMLPNPDIVNIVAECVEQYDIRNLVVDPVLIAQSGDALITEEASRRISDKLLPLCHIITPNIPEVEFLTGRSISNFDEAENAAEILHQMGAKNVLIKGGHFEGEDIGCDLFSDGKETTLLKASHVIPGDVHGTGCVLASAIAAGLALGSSLRESIEAAKKFVTKAIEAAYPLGKGPRPANPIPVNPPGRNSGRGDPPSHV
jgi:hydroxymethylpyrimidine kinase/phosphomethylpyrimidine kinase